VNKWSIKWQKLCELETKAKLINDKNKLIPYNQDFGHMLKGNVAAVYLPQSFEQLSQVVRFANHNCLPITIRANGLSQSGQSIASSGGLLIDMSNFYRVYTPENETIAAEPNATWNNVITQSLENMQLPHVYPYNLNLSVAGVISAGGVGASAFSCGTIASHIQSLDVMIADGSIKTVVKSHELFDAVISGQGQFGIITKVNLSLRACKRRIRTFFLRYDSHEVWLNDLFSLDSNWDYIEAFCSPCIQGARLTSQGRKPFADWFFCTHISMEFDVDAPSKDTLKALNFSKLVRVEEDTIESYVGRHDSRFQMMKNTGQWELFHPWYECFVPKKILDEKLPEILDSITLAFGSVYHVVPIALNNAKYFMMPNSDEIAAFMILSPGIHKILQTACLESHAYLNDIFLRAGGKRYLSGYLGTTISENYWVKHYGEHFVDRHKVKEKYDPRGIFCSLLHTDI
jgi:FAD/FMN-containing dehydrogenase